MTGSERTASIDRQLDASIAIFDGRIQHEQEVIGQQRGNGGGSGSGPDGTGPLGGTSANGKDGGAGNHDKGSGNGSGSNEGKDGKDGNGGNGGSNGQGKDGDGSKQGSVSGRGTGGPLAGGGGRAAIPPDISDGNEDDIVARQLREAAMAESDPELRDKLWQEYRNYKKSAK
jgi:hypothetical protein